MSVLNFPAELLMCPQCEGDLTLTREQVLFCVRCRLCYPILGGVPQLSLDQALPLSEEGETEMSEPIALFAIETGPQKGQTFRLTRGTCKVLGRRLDDPLRTQIFNADFTMTLDEPVKKLVYQHLKASSKGLDREGSDDLAAYKRMPDLILTDESVSRMHTMVYFDENGVGVLDLVSKNGTFVDDREIESVRLENGALLRIGQTQIRYFLR